MTRKRRPWPTFIAIVALGVGAASPALALRCDSKVISRGDHAAEVLRHCGEPIAVQSRLVQRSLYRKFGRALLSGVLVEVEIEEWTYNFGPHRLMRVVVLEDGIVRRVRQLGYGYLPR